MVIPAAHAFDFLRFCLRNHRPCPLLFVGAPGDTSLGALAVAGEGSIATDVPKYRIWRRGRLEEEVNGPIERFWREDLVTFLLGCSFSFEKALGDAGLVPPNVRHGFNVPMYATNVETRPSGPFGGPLVVSMRHYNVDQIDEVASITSRFPAAHGEPVHWGSPRELGIKDLQHPDFGDPPADWDPALKVPMFWCCGVTPQRALEHAGASVEFAITHAPGHMLVLDMAVDAFQISQQL